MLLQREPTQTAGIAIPLLLMLMPAALRAQPQTADGLFRRLAVTTHSVLTAPSRATPGDAFDLAVASGAVVLLISTSADESISRSISGHRTDTLDRLSDFGKALGEAPLNLGLMGVLAGYGLIRDDPRALGAAESGLLAPIISGGLIVPALKTAVGRSRPEEGKGSRDFHPFGGGSSMPSGHVDLAFSLAGTISYYYPGWPAWTAVALASTTAFSRVYTRSHWPSDALAGALIGYWTAGVVAEANDLASRKLLLMPIWRDGCSGAMVVRRF